MKRQREPIAAVQAGCSRAIPAILVLVCIVLPQLARAQGDVAPGNRALKAGVARLVQDTGIKPGEPGIAVLALKPGRVLVMEGYGLANIVSKEAITSCTRFELASVSKTFTATAVLILQERGLLSIDDDVRKYIPELPQYPNGPLRLRDLLQHVSGLTDYLELPSIPKSNKSYWVNADYLGALGKARLDFPIGQKYEYNNTNYMLLGLIVERVAGKPFGEVLRENIFAPVGMKNTFVYASPDSVPENAAPPCNNAVGYELKNKRWVARWGFPPGHRQEQHLEVGDGALWSNLEDMARWDAAIRTNKLIKPATMKLALTGSRRNKDYGLGWDIYRDDNAPMHGFGHDGYWRGFNTTYYNYLTDNHTVVLLSNRGDAIDFNKFWEKLSELIEAKAKE